MKSIAFPNILGPVNTKIFTDNDATISNLRLILSTELKSLFGDPGYGCGLKRFLFEQNSPIVRDLLIDKIYNTIRVYIPQLICKRNDIDLSSDKTNIYIKLTAQNLIDYTINTYNIALMNVQ